MEYDDRMVREVLKRVEGTEHERKLQVIRVSLNHMMPWHLISKDIVKMMAVVVMVVVMMTPFVITG